MIKNNLKKDFIWNTIGSIIHAFNSLLFLIVVTRINGLNNAGIFSYGFVISGIFLTVATFGGRNYQITDIDSDFDNNKYKSFRYFTTIVSVIIFALVLLPFKYSLYKYSIIFLLILVRGVESISDVYFGIFQKNNRLYLVGMSLFFKNLLTLIVFVLSDYLFKNLYISIILWIVINILFLVFFDIIGTKKIDNTKFKLDLNYKDIIKGTLYFFLFTLIAAFIIHIPRYLIDYYLTDELQGIYGILIMPATMTALLAQFVLQPYAVKLSNSNKNDKKEFEKELRKIVNYILIISFICIVLSYLFGIQILSLIYNINMSEYKYHLIIVMIGASFYAFSNLLGLVYTIKRMLKEQFVIYVVSLIISLMASFILINKYELLGGVISYLIIMMTIVLLYLPKLKK